MRYCENPSVPADPDRVAVVRTAFDDYFTHFAMRGSRVGCLNRGANCAWARCKASKEIAVITNGPITLITDDK